MRTLHAPIHCLKIAWRQDDIPRHAAALAYYSIFALPAFILVIITIAGQFIGERSITQELQQRMTLYAGEAVSDLLLTVIRNLQVQNTHPILSIIGMIILLFSAFNIIRHLRFSLNRILHNDPFIIGWRQLITEYSIALILLILFVTVLLSSITLQSALQFFENRLTAIVDIPWLTIELTNTITTFGALSILLGFFYRLLPKERFPFSAIARSSLLTSGCMISSAWIFTNVIGSFPIGKAYGVAATLLTCLLWIDVMAIIFLFGAAMLNCTQTQNEKAI